MNLYKTICHIPGSSRIYVEHASSAAAASKIRTRLKKSGVAGIETTEVEVPTSRTALIEYMNSLTAHGSWRVET